MMPRFVHVPLFAVLLSAAVLCGSHAAAAPRFPDEARLLDPNAWQFNSSGAMTSSFDEAEKAIRFDVTFDEKVTDRWIYPRFSMRPPVTLSGATAVVFEVKVLPVEGFAGIKTANFILDGFNTYEPPAPGEWKTVRISLEGKDLDNCERFEIGMNPNAAKHGFLLRGIRFEGTPRKPLLPPGIMTDAPGAVFFEQSAPVFTCTRTLPKLRYMVVDWLGATLMEGDWPQEGDAPLTLPTLPPGYYLLKTANDSEVKLKDFSFTVIVDPSRRRPVEDPFFAVDAALSWVASPGAFRCPWYDGDSYRLVMDLCQWAGLIHLRERMSWGAVQSHPDNAPNFGLYLENAKHCKERNIRISGMFHDCPSWAGVSRNHPTDMAALYRFCKAAGEAFGPCMEDWEFWNEQDIGIMPAWNYAAALKAAYQGFKAANPDMAVTIGAFCAGAASPYMEAVFDNAAAKYCDFLNYHTYSPLRHYNGLHDQLRKTMESIDRKDWQVWITECGTDMEGNATEESVRKGFKAHSPEQERILAEFYPKSQIGHMMNGVYRNYYFIFGAYSEREGKKDWGIIRRDGTLKPSYAVMSTMTFYLAGARLAGELAVNDAVKAFLFEQPDGTQTLVYWAVSNLDNCNGGVQKITTDNATTFTLPLADGDYHGADMVGTPFQLSARNGAAQIKATRYPSYLTGVKGFTANVAPRYPVGRPLPYVPAPTEDLAVVITADLNKDDFAVTNKNSLAELFAEKGRMQLHVWNLADTPKTGRLQVEGGTLQGLPETLRLPPMGEVAMDVEYVPSDNTNPWRTNINIIGQFEGKESTPLVIPLRLTERLLHDSEVKELDILKPEAWMRNTSADTYTVEYDEAEKALRFDVSWEDESKDRWFYPEHIIFYPFEDLDDVAFVEFEVKTAQDKVENDHGYACLMLCKIDEKDEYLPYTPPTGQWEKRRVELGPEGRFRIFKIRLGCNPIGMRMSFWLRNFRLIKQPKRHMAQ